MQLKDLTEPQQRLLRHLASGTPITYRKVHPHVYAALKSRGLVYEGLVECTVVTERILVTSEGSVSLGTKSTSCTLALIQLTEEGRALIRNDTP